MIYVLAEAVRNIKSVVGKVHNIEQQQAEASDGDATALYFPESGRQEGAAAWIHTMDLRKYMICL